MVFELHVALLKKAATAVALVVLMVADSVLVVESRQKPPWQQWLLLCRGLLAEKEVNSFKVGIVFSMDITGCSRHWLLDEWVSLDSRLAFTALK